MNHDLNGWATHAVQVYCQLTECTTHKEKIGR